MKGTTIIRVSLIFGSLIGLAVLTLSYLHSVDMFERSGYHGIFAHVGVIGFELMFVLGSIIMIWSKWVGAKVSGASKYVFYLGVGVNVYSNIASGFAQGKALIFYTLPNGLQINEPVLIGALIPMMFVGAELIITEAIVLISAESHTKVAQPTNKKRTGKKSHSRTDNSQTNVIEQVANQIKQTTGKLPSIRGLAKAADSTTHQARKVIDRIKSSVSKGA